MIDCSHANSEKDPLRQIDVAADLGRQIAAGDDHIFGVMVESHLKSGRQVLVPGRELVYGQSVTDGCIGWEESVPLLDNLAAAVRKRARDSASAPLRNVSVNSSAFGVASPAAAASRCACSMLRMVSP